MSINGLIDALRQATHMSPIFAHLADHLRKVRKTNYRFQTRLIFFFLGCQCSSEECMLVQLYCMCKEVLTAGYCVYIFRLVPGLVTSC